ncbi:MAG: hypothetical protein HYY17_09820 [Planctomycetes bacterium]|nr:hypothetical protein [Planctomycetota bacterium]
MLTATLAFAVLGCVQDPDRSTPDKALESFVAFWDRATRDVEFWRKVQREADEIGDSYRTATLREKLAKKREESGKLADDYRTVPGKLHVKERVPNRDECLFTCWRDMKLRSRNFTTGEVEERDTQEPYAFTFQKQGDEWLLKQMKVVCPSCSGTRACARCGGTGLYNRSTCSACNGKKTCPRCAGKAMVDASLTAQMLCGFPLTLSLFVAEGEFEPSSDRSGAKGAVKAYMDSWLRCDLVTTKRTLEWLDRKLAAFCAFLTPTNAEVARKVLQMDVDLGKKRYKGIKHEIRDLKERGDCAFAMTATTVDGVERKCGLLLESAEGAWSVAAHLSQMCVMCAGKGGCEQCHFTGKCAICKGTGKSGDYDCIMCTATGVCTGCKGKGGCESCRGFGWIEGD